LSHLISNKRFRHWLNRSRWKRRLSGRIEDAALVAFWTICGWLSPERASRFGAAVVGTLGPWTPKQEKIDGNLLVAFPEWSKKERRRVARAIWRNMGASAGEYPHVGTFGVPAGPSGVGVVTEIPPHLERNFSGERLTVFATGHLANWEVLAAAPRFWGVDLAVVYAPISDGIADHRLRAYRELMGSRLLPRDGSAKTLLRHLHSGRPIGIVADYRVDDGEALPFFDSTKGTTLSPARLALKTGADLIAVRVERLGPVRFKISAVGPLRPPPGLENDAARARAMMTEFNQHLERWIRERPEEWVCGKRAFDKRMVKSLRRGDKPAAAVAEVANVP
jgi:Kdo2-lipid IVA lauroyltransferase/acyltransferase